MRSADWVSDDGTIQLYRGDCLKLLPDMQDESVDTLITDPPYSRKFLPLYGGIAATAPHLLSDGGSMLAIVPHYAIPQVLVDVGTYLKYRWMLCMWQNQGSHPRMGMGIEVLWKPIGWWVKRAWPRGRGFIRDGFVNTHDGQALHKWQQGITWAEYCLHITRHQPVVCDPLMGSGTVGAACIKAKRPFIGIEIDPTAFDIAVQRCKDALQQRTNRNTGSKHEHL